MNKLILIGAVGFGCFTANVIKAVPIALVIINSESSETVNKLEEVNHNSLMTAMASSFSYSNENRSKKRKESHQDKLRSRQFKFKLKCKN